MKKTKQNKEIKNKEGIKKKNYYFSTYSSYVLLLS